MSTWAADAEENYRSFVSQLGQKTALAAEKHLELCEADAAQDYGRTWKRIAGMLGRLAPRLIEAMGHQALKFYIEDGKYRQQVFALADSGKGNIDLYMPDILATAITRKLLTRKEPTGNTFIVAGGKTTVELQIITSDDRESPPYCKGLLGWGRRAVHLALTAIPNEAQLGAMERLCELAAEAWKDRPAPAAPPQRAATSP